MDYEWTLESQVVQHKDTQSSGRAGDNSCRVTEFEVFCVYVCVCVCRKEREGVIIEREGREAERQNKGWEGGRERERIQYLSRRGEGVSFPSGQKALRGELTRRAQCPARQMERERSLGRISKRTAPGVR